MKECFNKRKRLIEDSKIDEIGWYENGFPCPKCKAYDANWGIRMLGLEPLPFNMGGINILALTDSPRDIKPDELDEKAFNLKMH